MDDRINYIAFFTTLAAPIIGSLLLFFRNTMSSIVNPSWLMKNVDEIIIILSFLSFFCYYLYESSIPVEYNIRVDLFIIGPVLFLAFFCSSPYLI